MSYKTIEELMSHLRENGIAISGDIQKQQLINTGYFHGYKGYRFFRDSNNRLPFVSYDEVYATIQYDTKLKTLFYDKIMFIETAVKNIALECILEEIHSESIQDMYDKAISSYKNVPNATAVNKREKYQQNKLNLQGSIQSYLARVYKNNNPQIAHFYNNMNDSGVPIWALFEIMTLGDFGFLLSCLTYDMRDLISKRLGLNLSSDTNRELVYKYLYTLKDLRNAVAHNDVVFDTRFRKISPTKPMYRCLEIEIQLPYVNFKTLGDFVILLCYYLRILKVSKREIIDVINKFEEITDEYQKNVNRNVARIVVHSDLFPRMDILKKYI